MANQFGSADGAPLGSLGGRGAPGITPREAPVSPRPPPTTPPGRRGIENTRVEPDLGARRTFVTITSAWWAWAFPQDTRRSAAQRARTIRARPSRVPQRMQCSCASPDPGSRPWLTQFGSADGGPLGSLGGREAPGITPRGAPVSPRPPPTTPPGRRCIENTSV